VTATILAELLESLLNNASLADNIEHLGPTLPCAGPHANVQFWLFDVGVVPCLPPDLLLVKLARNMVSDSTRVCPHPCVQQDLVCVCEQWRVAL